MTTCRIRTRLDESSGEDEVCVVDSNGGGGSSFVVYTLNPNTDVLFLHLQHLGIPLYQSSFDLYTLWFMLMTVPEFYRSVKKSPILIRVWEELWLPEQYDQVEIQIKKFWPKEKDDTESCSVGKEGTFSRGEIAKVLGTFKLRCNAVDTAWAMLKSDLAE